MTVISDGWYFQVEVIPVHDAPLWTYLTILVLNQYLIHGYTECQYTKPTPINIVPT